MTDTQIGAALAAFQADLPKVGKHGLNPHFKSKYATLEDITAAVLPALAKHGLSWVAAPSMTEHGFALVCTLWHKDGGEVHGMWPLASSGNAQQRGSELTYARRYMLTSMTGVAPDEDDDGNAAVTARQAPAGQPAKQAPPAPPSNWREVIAGTETVEALGTLMQQAQQAGWLTDEITAALNARKAEVEQVATP